MAEGNTGIAASNMAPGKSLEKLLMRMLLVNLLIEGRSRLFDSLAAARVVFRQHRRRGGL
jgi:hypothetical protein